MTTKKKVDYIEADSSYVFSCPHCDMFIQVLREDVNCQIFRHGVIRSSGEQVNQHSTKEYCDSLLNNNLVIGCCKPFKLILNDKNFVEFVDLCDYL